MCAGDKVYLTTRWMEDIDASEQHIFPPLQCQAGIKANEEFHKAQTEALEARKKNIGGHAEDEGGAREGTERQGK